MKLKRMIGLFFIALCTVVNSQTIKPTIAFYSAVSDSQDTDTIKMTQDLFYSQIATLDQYQLIDYRNTKWSPETKKTENISFYSEIQEKNGGWNCTLIAYDTLSGKTTTDTRQYESYYKILMDAKFTISELLSKALIKNKEENLKNDFQKPDLNKVTLESLSGTWKGEDFIDKIIILRGGRGFVIYKNGSSMNIKLEISDNIIIARQTSKPNASYFPEIPRNTALIVASNTKPIEWHFKIDNNDLLVGEKYSIKISDSSETINTEEVTLPVKWVRQ